MLDLLLDLAINLQPNGKLRKLTFDDVLLPGLSELLPSPADIRTRITRKITLNIPIVGLCHQHGHRGQIAIAMAPAGARRHSPRPGARAAAVQVRQVEKFNSGMVINPLAVAPDATLADALALMKDHGISGVPVVEARQGPSGQAGRHPDQSRRALRR